MTRSKAQLRAWYRNAMQRRIEELRELRAPLRAEARFAYDTARSVGQALRGSGATFGFAEVSDVAALLELSPDRDVLRRIEGVIEVLHAVADGPESSPPRVEWLLVAADLPIDDDVLSGVVDVPSAWDRLTAGLGVADTDLRDRVARYFELPVAELTSIERSALRLVPEALMADALLLPLSETSTSVVVATCEPTDLEVEAELSRVTGRQPVFAMATPAELRRSLADAIGATWAVEPPEDMTPPEEAESLSVPEAATVEHEDDAEPGTAAESEPEHSTEPAVARSTNDEDTPPATSGGGLGPRGDAILVVDDEESARHLLSALLRKQDHEVFQAEDGLHALERLHAEPKIGLVVADLNMPRMDGVALIREMKASEQLAGIPIIVVTSESDDRVESRLIEEGAEDYIRKPIDPRLFLARVGATQRRRGS